MKIFLLLFLFVSSAWAQTNTSTVTFFRDGQNQLSEFKGDYAGYGAHWTIYMDGRKLMVLHRGRMAVFSIPPGHHDFKTDKSERLSVEANSGESIFIRPSVGSKNHGFTAVVRLDKVSCGDFRQRSGDIQQAKSEDIFSGVSVKVESFAEACPMR